MCLRVWADTNRDTEKLRHDFVRHYVGKTLERERLITKPGHFSWTLLYPNEKREHDSADSNFSADAAAERDDDADEADDFGDTGQPMADNFDVEPDNEDDDDDPSNQVRVGESLGLD